MPTEPSVKRTVAFFDGQNLFYAVKKAFGYVAVIFSQDQDLSEVADEVRSISVAQNRWIKLACAFPVSPTYDNTRGISKTDWIEIDRAFYDACLDPNDYRAKGKP